MKLTNQEGASAVEFAIVLPLLVVLTFGIIEFSILFYDKAIITNASREGARAGIVFNGDYPGVSEADIKNVVDNYLGSHLITFGTPTPATTTLDTQCTDTGVPITITVTYPYNFLVLPNIVTSLAGTINLTAQTVMNCE